jgi:1,4-dihydroxy-2-naphthoate octaprenyltransferase
VHRRTRDVPATQALRYPMVKTAAPRTVIHSTKVRTMARMSDWVEGARPRTLPASVSPIFAGTGIAIWLGQASAPRALLAAAVALFFQIGVNFSNDYSDGIRGTDDVRSGPPRLTGGGKTRPGYVKAAAFVCFGLGSVAGLVLVALCGQWWLIALGVAAVLAAWFYTGGKHPYGYMGLGEIFVFVFFGLMATAGTTYTQALSVPWQGWLAASAIGLISCALLMVNNIRDIPTDAASEKHTLAVRLGDARARWSYALLVWIPIAMAIALLVSTGNPFTWLFFLPAAYFAATCSARVLGTRHHPALNGRALIPVLRDTGFMELAYGIGTFLAFVFA